MIFGVWANTDKAEFWRLFPELVEWSAAQGHQLHVTTRIARLAEEQGTDASHLSIIESAEDFARLECVLCLGGDGTILSAARRIAAHETPILGVHLGGFGFLAEVAQADLFRRLDETARGDYVLFPRMMMEGEVVDGDRSVVHALNDLVVDRGATYRLIKCAVARDGEEVNVYTVDGLIVCTPTGSTAYNLSAGGPILAPWLSLVCITPICAHTLSSRPIVLPSEGEIAISFPESPTSLRVTVDGQDQVTLTPGGTILIRKAPFAAQMVTFRDGSYFRTLRTKLGWGKK